MTLKNEKKWLKGVGVISVAMVIAACEEYGMGTQYEYNTYYYPEQNKQMFVGRAKDLRHCRRLVVMSRQQMNKSMRTDDYICCRITEESDCAKKLK
jgi:hypothetical protein